MISDCHCGNQSCRIWWQTGHVGVMRGVKATLMDISSHVTEPLLLPFTSQGCVLEFAMSTWFSWELTLVPGQSWAKEELVQDFVGRGERAAAILLWRSLWSDVVTRAEVPGRFQLIQLSLLTSSSSRAATPGSGARFRNKDLASEKSWLLIDLFMTTPS